MLHCAITDTFLNTVPLWITDNYANMDIFQNTDELNHYGTLIICEITDIFMNTVPLWGHQ